MFKDNKYLEDWLARKKAAHRFTVKEHREVSESFIKVYGPKSAFAVVRLSVEPAHEFRFTSSVRWPESENSKEYNNAVLDGILDELLCDGEGKKVLNASFELHEIKWHEIDSCQNAFYWAAREATLKLVGFDGKSFNYQ